MHDILATRGMARLSDIACSNALLGFDYDGTLAPTVADPRKARLRETTRRLLARVAEKYPCIVISGRAHDDLSRRLDRLPLWHVVGNHGLEPWAGTAGDVKVVKTWVDHLRAALRPLTGVVVEDKTHSATIHYRHARDHARAQRAIGAAVRVLPDARVLGGDKAVNLILRGRPDKGVALQRARQVLACDMAMYVGDDGTDEDAFASGPQARLLAVRVGRTRSSHAAYYLETQRHVDRLLQALLTLRTPSA